MGQHRAIHHRAPPLRALLRAPLPHEGAQNGCRGDDLLRHAVHGGYQHQHMYGGFGIPNGEPSVQAAPRAACDADLYDVRVVGRLSIISV